MNAKLLILLSLLALSACSSTGDKNSSNKGDPGASEKALYDSGQRHMEKGNYSLAIEQFDALETNYPFGTYAQQSQLDIAFAYYKMDEFDSAIAVVDQFLKLNPAHKKADYAYYIKGLSNQNRYRSFFDRVVSKDLSDLDPAPLRRAFDDFKLLVTRFPKSEYANDARQRMIFLRNVIALHEYKVADYYYRRGAYVAVINRCQEMIKTYDGADSIPDALVLLSKAYKKLEMKAAYADTLQLLEHNYPAKARGLR